MWVLYFCNLSHSSTQAKKVLYKEFIVIWQKLIDRCNKVRSKIEKTQRWQEAFCSQHVCHVQFSVCLSVEWQWVKTDKCRYTFSSLTLEHDVSRITQRKSFFNVTLLNCSQTTLRTWVWLSTVVKARRNYTVNKLRTKLFAMVENSK